MVRPSDAEAMDAIQRLLDGREWRLEDLDDIADVVRATGRPVREPGALRTDPPTD
jgi:hypothetical protein